MRGLPGDVLQIGLLLLRVLGQYADLLRDVRVIVDGGRV